MRSRFTSSAARSSASRPPRPCRTPPTAISREPTSDISFVRCARRSPAARGNATVRPCEIAPARAGDDRMKVSFFETGRYPSSPDMPREWPVPSAAYDPAVGAKAYRGIVERARLVEKLGLDWINLSEHHYSPRILTPPPPLPAAYRPSHFDHIQ